jgi:DNA-binding NtrC family response regulator
VADVLIVDDDLDAAEILGDVLRSEGHEVYTARDGREGLAALHAKPPDVVILDVEMPILTGPEMAYQVFLNDAGFERIPMVLCSGILGLRDVAEVVGTPYYLGKPFTLDAILALVARALLERVPPVPNLAKVS